MTTVPAHASLALDPWNMDARMALPLHIKVWLGGLMIVHLSTVFFLKHHVAARWVFGAFITSHAIIFAAERMGVVVLGGQVSFGHVVFWVPALIVLIRRRAEMNSSIPYRVWASAILFFYSVSLIFDVRDSFIWLSSTLRTL